MKPPWLISHCFFFNIFVVDEHKLNVKDDTPHIVEEDKVDSIPETESDDNLTVTDHEERPAETKEEQIVLDEVHSGPHVSEDEDGGHFNKNKNKDNQLSFSASDEMQKVPQATLENPLDVGLGVEVEHPPSGWSSLRHNELILHFFKLIDQFCVYKKKCFP